MIKTGRAKFFKDLLKPYNIRSSEGPWTALVNFQFFILKSKPNLGDDIDHEKNHQYHYLTFEIYLLA